MEISHAIVQGLLKEAGSNQVTEAFRNNPTPVNERLNELAESIRKVYARLTNNYGCFDEDRETYRFPDHLDRYVAGELDITSFSHLASRLIAVTMSHAIAATGGYALFIRYVSQGSDWLLIVMLKLRTSTGIDERSLELTDSVSFDIENLHEAARIDLAKWRRNDQPYLSFIKRRGQQEEVTRYFRLALGCTDYTDSRASTDRALRAVDGYCAEQNWTPDQKREARRKTYDYFDAKRAAGEPVNLIAFSAILNDQVPDSFLQYVRQNDLPVSETFEPHRRTYSRFKRISHSFGTVKISFDVQDVQDEKVDYEESDHAIIIRDVPETLADKIRRAKGHDSPGGPASGQCSRRGWPQY